jgi:hypothetical protein
MNGFGSTGKFVHLYINGLYWGVYNVVEEPDEQWAASNFGGDKDHYDVLEPDEAGGIEVKEGTGDAYNNLFAVSQSAFNSGGIDNAEYSVISDLVDMDALVGYILGVQFRGDRDAPVLINNGVAPRNFYAFHRNDVPDAKVIFQTWDGELSMDDVNFDRTEISGVLNPGLLFTQLRSNAEFRQFVTDKIYAVYHNGGPLDSTGPVNKPLELYNDLINELNVAIVGESARWGDSKRQSPYTRDADWIFAINWMRITYLAQRPAVIATQQAADFPATSRLPARFFINGQPSRGGLIASSSVVTLANQNSSAAGDVIYYTLDGSDPRLPGGGVSNSAFVYSTGVAITSTTTFTTRTLNGGTWTAKDAVTFAVAGNGLRVSEIAFQPTVPVGGTFSAGDYEFIELVNIGSTALDISGYAFNLGITHTIAAGTILQPGEYAVIVKSTVAFAQYGNPARVIGQYGGSLANEGETLTLVDSAGTILQSFAYANNWYPVTAGGGHSLVIRDALADKSVWATAPGWRPSQVVGGSPGAIDVDAAPNANITAVTPNVRNTTVNTISMVFTEPVLNFDLADLSLTLGGSSNLLTAAQTLTTSDGGKTWTLGNLAGLMTADGVYSLTLAVANVTDLTAKPLAAGAASSFTIDRVAPAAQSSAFLLSGASPQVRFNFSESLVAGASAPVLTVIRNGGTPVTIAAYSIVGTSITFDLPMTLPDGRYTAMLVVSGARDTAGNAAAQGMQLPFAFLAGDIDGDLSVDFDDLVTLSQNYDLAGKSYLQGNINFSADGLVDFADLIILAQKYGMSLPAELNLIPPLVVATPTKKSAGRGAVGPTILA